MNFCKDCQYAVGDVDRLQCGSPKNSIEYMDMARYAVTGIEVKGNAALASSCIAMRTHVTHPTLGVELCGPDGKWWEKKA